MAATDQLKSDSNEILKCGDVIASDRGITETEKGRQMQFVPRASIKSIGLRYGCAAHRPILEMCVGIGLTCLAVYDLYGVLVSMKVSRYDLGMIVLGLIGGYLIFSVVRRHHHLHIVTDKTHFNIRFANDAALSDINAFCDEMEKKWSYAITR